MGLPCDLPAILRIADQHGLPVVEDAACAIGSEIRIGERWEQIGKPHGAVACFSFHPRKVITTGDGGMLTTSDPELDRKFRLLRQHAMSIPDTVRHAARTVVFEEYPEVGYNYRMTDIQAAIGRVQLERLPGILTRRRALAARYHQALTGDPGSRASGKRPRLAAEPPVLPGAGDAGLSPGRDALMQALLERGVSTRRGIMNAHQEPAYAGMGALILPHSESARDQAILLPLYDGMAPEDQDYVIDCLRELSAAG